MKKTLLLASLLALSTVFAFGRGNNEIQLGGTVGTMYGLDFKVKKNHFAFIADLGINLFTSPTSLTYSTGGGEGGYMFDALTFEFNPNIAFQKEVKSFSAASLDFYIGGGVSGGMLKPLMVGTPDLGKMKADVAGYDNLYGKMGVNMIAGIDFNFNKVPLALSFDFRPGYGLGMHHYKSESDDYLDLESDYTEFAHFFDWKLVVGVRYRF